MPASGKGTKKTKAARAKTKTRPHAKSRRKTRVKTTLADTGPVTLAEAKALALARQPKLAARAVRKDVPPASPEKVGIERKILEKERRDEIARRVREYRATMEIMKRRGARRPRPKGKRGGKNRPRRPDRSCRYKYSPRGIRGSTIRFHSLAAASSRASRIGSVSRS